MIADREDNEKIIVQRYAYIWEHMAFSCKDTLLIWYVFLPL